MDNVIGKKVRIKDIVDVPIYYWGYCSCNFQYT